MDTITYSITASSSVSNLSLSVPTGILFDKSLTLHCEFAVGLNYKNFGVNVAYNGYYSIGGMMVNLTDLSCSYSINSFSFSVGYEFIYNQYPTEESSTSHAVFGTAALKKNKLSMVGIVFYNIPDNFVYLILSSDYKVSEKVNIHGVVGYTTGEPYPIYGLLGPQFINKKASIGTYITLRKDATGFMVELKGNLY